MFRWRVLVVMLVSVCGLVYIHVERLGVCKLVWGLSLVCVCLPPPHLNAFSRFASKCLSLCA